MGQVDDHDKSSSRGQALAIYLQDHHAAALAGTAVARRASENMSRDIDGRTEFERVATEIAEDLDSLERVMATAGIPRNRVKDALVVTAERLGRLKLNGRLIHRARLSDVIELETLYVGITGKLALWQSLASAEQPIGVDLEALAARARGQRDVVSRCHQSASSRAFGVREYH